jgi:hypothetical protein
VRQRRLLLLLPLLAPPWVLLLPVVLAPLRLLLLLLLLLPLLTPLRVWLLWRGGSIACRSLLLRLHCAMARGGSRLLPVLRLVVLLEVRRCLALVHLRLLLWLIVLL